MVRKYSVKNNQILIGFMCSFLDIKAVIFDCDGTLLHSEQVHYRAWRHALHEQGYELSEELYINHFIGFCDLTISKLAVKLIGLDYPDKLLKNMHEYYSKYQLEGIPPISHTIKFLNHLNQEKERFGLKLAVASGSKKDEIIQNLKTLQIENYFDVVLSGFDDLTEYKDSEGTNKPKPYVYLKAANMLGYKPQQCIAIEDSRSGISAAVTAGCITVAVPNDFTRQQDLSHAHLKIESFDGLDFIEFLKRIPHSAKPY